MKTLFRLLAGLVAALIGLTLVVCLLVVARAPTVNDPGPLAPAAIEVARNLVRQASLRDSAAGSLRVIKLHAGELEQVLNYGLQSQYRGAASVAIADSIATVRFSLPVKTTPFGSWINGEVAVTTENNFIRVQSLRAGQLPVPAWIGNFLLPKFHSKLLQRSDKYVQVVAALNSVVVAGDEIVVSYQWQPQLMAQLAERGRELIFEPGQQQRLQAHALQLAQITRDLGGAGKQSITALMAPMFRFAAGRGGMAVEENRAALQILAAYVLNMNPQRLLGDIDGFGKVVRHDLRLSGRRDFAQHFLLSAALAVSAGNTLAAEIGVLKERQDTEAGGSGFSFTDLAIDEAGARFGHLAVADDDSARALQQMVAVNALQENVFTPEVKDLPEFMSQQEFAERFDQVGSPKYQEISATIDQRIAQLPLVARLQK